MSSVTIQKCDQKFWQYRGFGKTSTRFFKMENSSPLLGAFGLWQKPRCFASSPALKTHQRLREI